MSFIITAPSHVVVSTGQDPHAPKRPQGSFFLFSAEVRERIKAENPAIATKDISSKAGEMWKALSEDEKKV